MSRALTFNTYGGNPLASAVGIAVLDAIEEDGCQEIADTVGTHLLKSNQQKIVLLQELFQVISLLVNAEVIILLKKSTLVPSGGG